MSNKNQRADLSKGSEKVNKGSESDSHVIGPRQEYRRTGTAPDASDASNGNPEHGKPSTPYKY